MKLPAGKVLDVRNKIKRAIVPVVATPSKTLLSIFPDINKNTNTIRTSVINFHCFHYVLLQFSFQFNCLIG